MPDIIEPHNFAFGDQWATINLCLHRSLLRGETVRLHHRTAAMGALHREIVDVLDSPGKLELTPEPFTRSLDGYSVWSTPYFPTQRRWSIAGEHRTVTIQVDGRSAASDKNPDAREQVRLAEVLRELVPDLEIVTLGDHLSVAECVEQAARSAFFLGVDSGMAHLCHSVGVPVFLLEYRLPVVTCHRGKSYRLCQGANDFREKLLRWRNYLRDSRE
jgi:hypothetical protein